MAVASVSAWMTAVAVAALLGAAPAQAADLRPVADTVVDATHPGRGHGSAPVLEVSRSPRRRALLRFDLRGLDGAVATATLLLHVTSRSGGRVEVRRLAGSPRWSERRTTYRRSPHATRGAVRSARLRRRGRLALDVTRLITPGRRAGLAVDGAPRAAFASREHRLAPRLVVTLRTPAFTPWPTAAPPRPAVITVIQEPAPDAGNDPVVAAAGDIACQSGSSCGHRATSDLLVDRPEITRVLALGDLQYENGLLAEFLAPGAYDDTWGRLRPITAPVPGNHEYGTAGAAGYFDYFNGPGNATGLAGDRNAGYYSFDLGSWHLLALNSNLAMATGSVQERWLRQDLAAHPATCALAYFHAPRWTSGAVHGPATGTGPLWDALHDAGADVVLGAHNHQYERFAPQDPSGAADWRRGIRQFVAGTGGAGLYDFGAPSANSEVRARSYGVLELTLGQGRYDWRFRTTDGRSADQGSARCHGAAPAYARRGLFSREQDGGFARIASLGFSLIDSVPGTVADLPPGLEAMVWVGNYDDDACAFEMTDAELRGHVEALAGDPRVGVWFISDEPSPDCPGVYAQHTARTALIKSVDPDAEVLVVVDGNSGDATLEQIPHWRGVADHIGINPYTCWQGRACAYEWIDRVTQAADAAGLDYWGVVQAFGEPNGEGFFMCTTSGCGRPRLPTASEIHGQFDRWRASRMTGYLVFEWRWPDRAPALWLANQPDLQAALAGENAWP